MRQHKLSASADGGVDLQLCVCEGAGSARIAWVEINTRLSRWICIKTGMQVA
jgi:hypothetical protein